MKHSVVLVDDIAEIRQILRLLLRHSGWFDIVGEGRSGEEAVVLAERLRPALMVLDVELPGGPTGWQVLPRIKEVSPDTKVVVLSGSVADDTAPGKQELASAVIEKGVPPQELIHQLLTVVTGSGDAGDHADTAGEGGHRPPDPRARASLVGSISQEDATARLVALVQSASDAIIGTSLDGEILSWNPAATRMYGYEASQVIGRPISILVPPERPDEVPALLRRIAAGQQVEQFETVRVHRDGRLLDVSLTISPVLLDDGRIIGASTIARDISSRRESDEALASAIAQLEQSNRELRRSNEELDSFASVASHDLAQPLQVAYGYLEMVRTEFGAGLDPTAVSWLEAAAGSLERMRGLVQDILSFARTGNRELAPERVDLVDAADVAVTALSSLIEECGATLDVGPLPVVAGNEAQLAQLLQNLIGNGIKYVPAGRAPVVAVSAERRPDGVIVNVDDNGDGVPATERERIFDMFQRAHGPEVSGTGLGLAVCRKIVARHGGRIWVEEAPTGGARFRFLLPDGPHLSSSR